MRLTALTYYADLYLSAAAILYLMVTLDVSGTVIHAAQFVSWTAIGFAAWTAFEYFVHRVLYHNVPVFKDLHDAHHAKPNAFIGAPPVIGPVLIFASTYYPALAYSDWVAKCLTIGMLLGYIAYMVLHHAAHHWNVSAGSWLYSARRHHALHHHHKVDGNYGITTSFWDHVFGTALEPWPYKFRLTLR